MSDSAPFLDTLGRDPVTSLASIHALLASLHETRNLAASRRTGLSDAELVAHWLRQTEVSSDGQLVDLEVAARVGLVKGLNQLVSQIAEHDLGATKKQGVNLLSSLRAASDLALRPEGSPMPDQDKQRAAYAEFESRVGHEIAKRLTRKQTAEFERLLELKDDDAARLWLERTVPNYPEIVRAAALETPFGDYDPDATMLPIGGHGRRFIVSVLGQVEVRRQDRMVRVLGGGMSRLLSTLVAGGPDGLTIDDLGSTLWDDPEPPSSWRASLRMTASRLRKVLPEATLVSSGGVYKLDLPQQAVDLWFLDMAVSQEIRLPETDILALIAEPPFGGQEVNGILAERARSIQRTRGQLLERLQPSQITEQILAVATDLAVATGDTRLRQAVSDIAAMDFQHGLGTMALGSQRELGRG